MQEKEKRYCETCGCQLRQKQRAKYCDPCKPEAMLEKSIRAITFSELDEVDAGLDRYFAEARGD